MPVQYTVTFQLCLASQRCTKKTATIFLEATAGSWQQGPFFLEYETIVEGSGRKPQKMRAHIWIVQAPIDYMLCVQLLSEIMKIAVFNTNRLFCRKSFSWPTSLSWAKLRKWLLWEHYTVDTWISVGCQCITDNIIHINITVAVLET